MGLEVPRTNGKTSSGFSPPGEQHRIEKIGNLSNECSATCKALENIPKYWEPMRMPKRGDWLDSYNHGYLGYDKFAGKIANANRNVIYIQPLVYKRNSAITQDHLKQLKKWMEAFYMPCKVVILDTLTDDKIQDLGINTKKNYYNDTQYNAINILQKFVGPIQRKHPDALGVVCLTDVDLYTKDLSNFCFGYGNGNGGVHSIHRFLPKWTDEAYENEEEFNSRTLMRIVQLATHEFGHMLGLGHCTLYQCLMMGINHLEQSDRSPLYFCPACYRKIWKCLKFDHVARYQALTAVCNEFAGVFTESHLHQKDEMSPHAWFQLRHTDLQKKIKAADYSQLNKYAAATSSKLTLPAIASRSNSASKQSNFLRRGSGQNKRNTPSPQAHRKWK